MANKNRNRNKRFNSSYAAHSDMGAYYYKWLSYIERLAMSRFQWNNLPESCSERYLERTLMMMGQAVFFEYVDGLIMATKTAVQGPFTVYHDPTKLVSIGDNGWYYEIPEDQGVMVYDTLLRRSQYPILLGFASELAELDGIRRTNRIQQRAQVVLTAPESRQADLERMLKDLSTNEWVGMTVDSGISESVEAIKLGIEYKQKDFQEEETNIINKIYSFLGIEHLPYEKSERLVTSEAAIATDAISRIREDALLARQFAADEINKMYGTDISVEWRTNQAELMTDSYGEDEHGGRDENGR